MRLLFLLVLLVVVVASATVFRKRLQRSITGLFRSSGPQYSKVEDMELDERF